MYVPGEREEESGSAKGLRWDEATTAGNRAARWSWETGSEGLAG